MESIYTELALYGSKNECARTETVFLLISEVCDGTVSLTGLQGFLTNFHPFDNLNLRGWTSKILLR